MEASTGRVVTPAVDGFAWTDDGVGRMLRAKALAPLAVHAFTTRDVSFRGETEPSDYARLAKVLGVARQDLALVSQVHGREVLVLTAGRPHPAAAAADAIVSTDAGRAIGVRVADCVPILLADTGGVVVAAVHAGWKGTAAGVAMAAVERMVELGAPASTLVAAIGPSIGPCCYQVDDRVREAFLWATPDAASWFEEDGPGHWKLDLWQANADTLAAAGVPEANIHLARLCTRDHPETCFSYRREGAGAGRMVAAIRLAPVSESPPAPGGPGRGTDPV
jgi:YfiH family protein